MLRFGYYGLQPQIDLSFMDVSNLLLMTFIPAFEVLSCFFPLAHLSLGTVTNPSFLFPFLG